MKLIDNSTKTNWKYLAIAVILSLAIGVLLFVPVPYYQSHDALCKPCASILNCPPCPQKGWHWGPSLWEQLNPDYTSGPPEVETQLTTPSPVPTGYSETDSWQTYRNDEFGFEVRYPKDWFNITLEDIVGGSSFEFSNKERTDTESGAVVVQVSFGDDLDLFSKLRNATAGKTIEKNLIFYTKIRDESVAGYPAVRYKADYRNIPAGVLPTEEEVLMKKDNHIIHFKSWGDSSQIIQENQKIYDQIVSTFQFVD